VLESRSLETRGAKRQRGHGICPICSKEEALSLILRGNEINTTRDDIFLKEN
jgi:hypothetical protein